MVTDLTFTANGGEITLTATRSESLDDLTASFHLLTFFPTINLVETLPDVSDMEKSSIYGEVDNVGDSANGLWYRRKEHPSTVRVRFDDVSSRSQFATNVAYGYANVNHSISGEAWGVGGAVSPTPPSDFHAVV